MTCTCCRGRSEVVKGIYAKLIAVRRVTQDNRGKNTPGVDGQAGPLLRGREAKKKPRRDRKVGPPLRGPAAYTSAAKRSQFAGYTSPNPGKRTALSKQKRPLGIPTIQDRATQALAKMALAKPNLNGRPDSTPLPNSYGFRPGRSCHDAIEAIHCFAAINKKPKYVLDGDIRKCFDKIKHDTLIEKQRSTP
jgi:RNA-directed DNA polymerase